MKVFVVEAQRLGFPAHIGVCGCGLPVPAMIIDKYEADFQCPRCGRRISVKIGIENGLAVSFKQG